MIFTDQIGKTYQLAATPQRIVCLVPSLTELLYDLGLEDSVIAITKFCFEPDEWFRTKNRIGGTKTVDIAKVKALNPDLIIANKEENDKIQVETLSATIPTYTSQIVTIYSALEAIKHIGEITQTSQKAKEIITTIKTGFETIKIEKNYKVAYFVWNEPLMVAGGDTFINTMLEKAGFQNIFSHKNRYPMVSIEDILNQKPDLLLLPSEPFPFKEKHLAEFVTKMKQTKAILVKGDMFSWYGSRMCGFPSYIQTIREGK